MHIVLDLQACQSLANRQRGIGRYSLALAKAIAESPRGHEITVLLNMAMDESIEHLRAQFDGLLPQERVRTWSAVKPTAYLDPSNAFRRNASQALRLEVLRQLQPDVVHVASMVEGYADDQIVTVSTAEVPYVQAVTFYDLIPLANPSHYLTLHSGRQWYMAQLECLRRADVVLGISNASCDEARKLLSIPQERLTNISGAADSIFHHLVHDEHLRAEVMGRYRLTKPFVLYTGGFDPRKNIAGLIRAFALLPSEFRRAHQLVIVGGAPAPERVALQNLMAEVGVAAEEVAFTGYVSDHDLVKLYNLCALFICPSLHEGFGLPALEAMSCGAVVIGSNTSSLPEVIGHAGALFDPHQPRAIADKIVEAMTDCSLRRELLENGRNQPLKFSWRECARRALDAFEAAQDRCRSRRTIDVPVRVRMNERIAFLPAPDTAKRAVDGAVVYADDDSRCPEAARPLARFPQERDRFDRVIVELADDPYCAKTIPLVADLPVDLLLRDTSFAVPLSKLAEETTGRTFVESLLYRSGGYEALRAAIDAGFSPRVLAEQVSRESLSTLGNCQLTATDGADVAEMGYSTVDWRDCVREFADGLMELEGNADATDEDWTGLASAISQDLLLPVGDRQWLIDVSIISISDAGTGIQRVVRHVLDELLKHPPSGYRVEPIYLSDDRVFRYARRYCAQRYFPQCALPPDEPVEFRPGDIYLGLDLGAHLVAPHLDLFRWMRCRGVAQFFMMYDLLPIRRPDCFAPELLPTFQSWCEAVSEVADGVVCISRTVADEFDEWLSQSTPARERVLGIGYVHLGADLVDARASERGPARLTGLGDRPTFLSVGTIEPRKGYAQTLGAFEQLWLGGAEINLVIVGRAGWLSDSVIQRLRDHTERGRRLFWFENADDDLLVEAFRRASALLMASEGEGFGLPLIEAAQYGVPLIVRDLPVFCEVVGEHGHYFHGNEPADLARSIVEWLALESRGAVVPSGGMKRQTWCESAAQLVEVITHKRWVHTWVPASKHGH